MFKLSVIFFTGFFVQIAAFDCQKIYVKPETVFVQDNGIFVHMNGEFFPVEGIRYDDQGLFLEGYTPNTEYVYYCTKCKKAFDMFSQHEQCPHKRISTSDNS